MNRWSAEKDRTAQRNPSGGGTGSTAIKWQCGCTRRRQTGAVTKGPHRVPVACHLCAGKGRA